MTSRIWFIPFLIFLFLNIGNLHAQIDVNNDTIQIKIDSIEIKELMVSQRDTIYIGYDTVLVIKNYLIRDKDTLIGKNTKYISGLDTIFSPYSDKIITFRDTIITSIDTVHSLNERVLKKIENFSNKKNLFSRLLKNVLVFDEHKPPPDTSKASQKQSQSGQDRYSDYNNLIIGNIHITVLDVFGGNIENPHRKPSSLLEKGGNAIHKTTYRNIIRNKLLFDRGEVVNSIKISESERLLRQSNYLYDAQIKIFPRLESDTVDVYVIVQDVWSITPGAGFSPGAAPATDINIRDVNFFGLGQDFYNTVKLKKTLPEKYNFTSVYTINNLYRTQSLAQLFYRFENGETRYGVGINREFISSAIKFAGGLNYTSYNNDKYVLQYNILNPDSISTPLRYNYQDVWIGYANRPSKKSDFGSDRFVIGARVQRTQYTNRPITRLKNQFLNNNFYLFNLGYVERTFFKDNYIFRLGRTEDIPEGTLVVLTTGYQYGENLRRPYYGILSTWSRYVKKAGYFYASAGIGAFRSNKFWEEGSYYAKGLYYTPLIRLGTWKLRNFISVRGTHAIKQQPGVFTDVNSDNGLRALNSILLKGTDKLAINIENDFFPDFNFIGFRMGFIIFTDLAWIGNQEKLFDKSNFFQGYGIGLRIRNENLVFSMFQFLFGIYPGAERLDQNNLHFFDRTKYFYNYDDLGISRPSVIPLN